MYNVQYIVVRRDLIDKFGFGFMAAQMCHASVAPITNAIKKLDFDDGLLDSNNVYSIGGTIDEALFDWCFGRFVKYVYEVPDLNALTDLCDRLSKGNIQFYGITELVNKDEKKVNQTTCIGLKPYDKGRIAPYFRNLQLLK